MTAESEDLDSDEEIQSLRELIRKSRALQARDRSAIPPELLAIYLEGKATPEEVQRIQEALVKSKDLRNELLYAAGLYDPETQAEFDKALAPAEATGPDPAQTEPQPHRDIDRRLVRPWLWVVLAMLLIVAAVLLFRGFRGGIDLIP